MSAVLESLARGFVQAINSGSPEGLARVERDLADGQHANPTGKPEYFMETHFHHPDELAGEVEKAGFVVDGVYGIEGPGWLAADFDAWWDDPPRRERLLHLARRLETEPSLLGISAHLMAAARKP
jgi:hypothetical protein